MIAAAELARATKKLSIPVASPDEKVTIVWKGEYDYRGVKDALAKTMLAEGHPSLRLVPLPESHVMEYEKREQMLGEKHVALATVDEEGLAEAFKGYTPPAEEPKRVTVSDYAVQRAEQARKEQEHDDRLRMVQRAAAPIFASKMPEDKGLLALMLYVIGSSGRNAWFENDYRDYETDSPSYTLSAFTGADLRGKQEIVAGGLLWKWTNDTDRIDADDVDMTYESEPQRFADYIADVATSLGVKLPKGWADVALIGSIPEERPWIAAEVAAGDEGDEVAEETDDDAEAFDDVVIVEEN
jgi:hypothetical protein